MEVFSVVSDSSINVTASFYFKIVGVPVRLRTLKPEGETRGFLYTVLVLLIFIASYLRVVIQAVLASLSVNSVLCKVRTACVYICVFMCMFMCAYISF